MADDNIVRNNGCEGSILPVGNAFSSPNYSFRLVHSICFVMMYDMYSRTSDRNESWARGVVVMMSDTHSPTSDHNESWARVRRYRQQDRCRSPERSSLGFEQWSSLIR